MNHGTAALEVRDLSFAYGAVEVLTGLSLAAEKGSLIGIIGPNGAGKTTLLRCLMKILQPAAGSILVLGRDLAELSLEELARKVGIVPQMWAADFAFTVEEVVLMGRLPHLRRFQRETAADLTAAREAMAQTGLLRLADRPITTLSGGELQRVIIAQALAQSPEILLLDEPTSHLDLRRQLETIALIGDLARRRGITVLAVFHDLNLAARHCDRLILMAGGKVLASGPPAEVLTAANLTEAYGVQVEVIPEPGSGLPIVIPRIEAPEPGSAAAGREEGRAPDETLLKRPAGGGLTLVLGGARSGKSRFAQETAAALGGRVAFIATAVAADEEMAARIARHRAARPNYWITMEAPLDPAAAIRASTGKAEVVIVDCLTIFLSNLLLRWLGPAAEADSLPPFEFFTERAEAEVARLLGAVRESPAAVILVANEVGEGVVPPTPLGRLFRDLAGWANQRLACEADLVFHLSAGLAVEMKSRSISPAQAALRIKETAGRGA